MNDREIETLEELTAGRHFAIIEATPVRGKFRVRLFDSRHQKAYRTALRRLISRRGVHEVTGVTIFKPAAFDHDMLP